MSDPIAKAPRINELEWLQTYYLSMCDGDWEHGYGFEIGTLDNPGWHFKFDIADTSLEGVEFNEVVFERTDNDWVHCRLEGNNFKAYCGPKNLTEVISIFRTWVESARPNEVGNV